MEQDNNTYGTIRKRKSAKPQPQQPGTSALKAYSYTNEPKALYDTTPVQTPKRKKPLPRTPGGGGGKENEVCNTPVSCSKLSSEDMKKVLPVSPANSKSPSHVLSPKQRRISKGKRSMSPKPARPKNWTLSDRFDPQLILAKEAAIKEAEYVLGVISEYQRRIQVAQEEDTDIAKLTAIAKIDNDCTVIAKTLQPLSSGVPAAPSTPSKKSPLALVEPDEAAILENKLFMIAKKLIDVKAVIERTESVKRTTVMTKLISSIKSYLITGEVPTNLPHVPVEMAISLLNPATASTKLKENVYRSAFLKKQGRKTKILRKRWFALNHYQFQIFDSSRTNKKAIALDTISNITCTLKDGYYHMVITSPGKKTVLASKNRIEMAKWVVTIDSMIRPEFTSIITSPAPESEEKSFSKEQLLCLLYKEPFGSGKMTSETYEEWWDYNGSTGILVNSKWGDALEYIWDGSTLQPTKMSQMTLGVGKWNGVWLAWYTEKNEPFLKYYYSAGDRKYLASTGQSLLTWQWALNQLVGEGGEWICDGNIPHPVVMFLQMMRYYRLGR